MDRRRFILISVLGISTIIPLYSSAERACKMGGVHEWGSWGSWKNVASDIDGINCTWWRIRNCTKCNTTDNDIRDGKCNRKPC